MNNYRTHKTSYARIVRNSIGISLCLLDTICIEYVIFPPMKDVLLYKLRFMS